MTPAFITQWLQQPHTEVAPDALQELLQRYPYFTPLHYMATATALEPGKEVILDSHPALHRGNWLLFYQLMKEAAQVPVVAEIIEEVPVVVPEQKAPEKNANQQRVPRPIPSITPDDTPAKDDASMKRAEDSIIQPVFTEDYFLHQGTPASSTLSEDRNAAPQEEADAIPEEASDPQSLMVVMSFTEWLMHYKSKTQKEKEDEEGRKAVKHMWQKEKLAAALEEEDDEIPENVFEMAVNSISKEDGLVSESLAEILAKQGKWDKAIDMYRKLSLRNPQKSTYFAQQIAAIQKKSE